MAKVCHRFEVVIEKASVVRVFNKFRSSHDLYVCIYAGVSGKKSPDKMMARTMGADNCGLAPKWDETFVFKTEFSSLTFKLYSAHVVWPDTLIGTASFSVDGASDTVCAACNQVDLKAPESGEIIGKLHFSIEDRAKNSSTMDRGASVSSLEDFREVWSDASEFKSHLSKLLNQPQKLQEVLHARFRQVAQPNTSNISTAPCLSPDDLGNFVMAFARQAGVEPAVFGAVDQIFWRFEFSGHGVLYEDEAVRAATFVLRLYRDATDKPRPGTMKLGNSIANRNLDAKYKLLNKLGEGGQGSVWKAIEKGSDPEKEVVIKTYSRFDDNNPVEDITAEFELLMTLSHPRIARVFEIFQDGANIYVAQEPYYGGDLTTALDTAKANGVQITEYWLSFVMKQVLLGVQFLHGNYVIHSDIKEANVMVAMDTNWAEPEIVIIDFGLVNQFNQTSHGGGTPGYMPPEVWEKSLWTPRGDIFSTGVMMFVLLEGNGESPFVVGAKTMEDVEDNTRMMMPQLTKGSPELQDLVMSMMQKTFTRRPTVPTCLADKWFENSANKQAHLDTDVLTHVVQKKKKNATQRAFLADLASRSNLAHLKELNALFTEMDTDNDGLITAKEMRKCLKGVWSDEDINSLVKSLIGDSVAEDAEQGVSYNAFMGQMIVAKEKEENALFANLFHEADTDGSGYLEMVNIETLMKRPAVARVLGNRSAEDVMRQLDLNGDGVVSFDEFKKCMQGADSAKERWVGALKKTHAVQVFHPTKNEWITTNVTDVCETTGKIKTEHAPDLWLSATGGLNQWKIRKSTPA